MKEKLERQLERVEQAEKIEKSMRVDLERSKRKLESDSRAESVQILDLDGEKSRLETRLKKSEFEYGKLAQRFDWVFNNLRNLFF